MIASPSNAGSPAEITRNSGSTLAFALRWLPRDRRADMRDFYAFCRVIDDLADDPTLEFAAKRDALDAWRASVTPNPTSARTGSTPASVR